MNITFELYGVARLRAGRERVVVQARDLGGALKALQERCPGLAGDVLRGGRLQEHFRLSRNGHLFVSDPALRLSAGDTLILLSAATGG